MFLPIPLRPGKIDSLFLISHFLGLEAGGRSLLIQGVSRRHLL